MLDLPTAPFKAQQKLGISTYYKALPPIGDRGLKGGRILKFLVLFKFKKFIFHIEKLHSSRSV